MTGLFLAPAFVRDDNGVVHHWQDTDRVSVTLCGVLCGSWEVILGGKATCIPCDWRWVAIEDGACPFCGADYDEDGQAVCNGTTSRPEACEDAT